MCFLQHNNQVTIVIGWYYCGADVIVLIVAHFATRDIEPSTATCPANALYRVLRNGVIYPHGRGQKCKRLK